MRLLSSPEDFVAWLETFPDSRSLATWLANHGIKGEPSKPFKCPLAVLGQELTGLNVGVSCQLITAPEFYAVTPDPVVRFIKKFDNGEYPKLLLDQPMPYHLAA